MRGWASGAERGGIHRTDDQILEHAEDVELLGAIAAGRVTTRSEIWMDPRRLACEELILAGSGIGTTPILLPRGQRILDVANGMLPRPAESRVSVVGRDERWPRRSRSQQQRLS